jgi:DNA polymerase III delta prime subunit
MSPDKRNSTPKNNNVSISGDVVDSVVVVGNENTVNQTIIQKFFNIFKSDSETLEHRNRRILLGHVENAWIKGVLDASLHGAALLDLGIKQDPEAVTKYPWAIKKESTDETLPAETSMLEIFDSVGMGRSLLILGAPGSGKTTMLLELARQLIARAREDMTEPIPMVFNLASWTEKLTLTDWLAQELNNLYSVPRKTAPDWVQGNKLLLLLDGLDEVRQESRAKCVDAINAFRKEHGLTSLAVCSRSQDYADLKAKLAFEGAIEVQPLTQEQITAFFNRFGDEMTGIKQALEKDSSLREMAETPLFLSIMIMAYRDKRDVEILVSGDEKARRKHLFDTYIERMFENPRSKTTLFQKQDVLHWLSWLASRTVEYNQVPYLIEDMQPQWIGDKKQVLSKLMTRLIGGLIIGLITGLIGWLITGLIAWLLGGLIFGGLNGVLSVWRQSEQGIISSVDTLSWNWNNARKGFMNAQKKSQDLFTGLFVGLNSGLNVQQMDQTTYPGQKLVLTAKNFLFAFLFSNLSLGLIFGLSVGVFLGMIFGPNVGLGFGLILGLSIGLTVGLEYGGSALIQHYTLRYILTRNNILPWRLVPFLNHCVDLIFLRRVGGGYIFVHRLLMEHFAEMYVETPTSKGN